MRKPEKPEAETRKPHRVLWFRFPDGKIQSFRWGREVLQERLESTLSLGAVVLPDPFKKGMEPRNVDNPRVYKQFTGDQNAKILSRFTCKTANLPPDAV